jgi:hypothetical protein
MPNSASASRAWWAARKALTHLRRAMMGVTAATMVMGLAVLVSAFS